MVAIPQQLFEKASTRGLICESSDTGEHRIGPRQSLANWQLVCQQEVWVLVVNGFPQIRMRYSEVLAFIERLTSASGQG